jgi:hypothetical protein
LLVPLLANLIFGKLGVLRGYFGCLLIRGRTRMRVALLEASHWHVPLYLDSLEANGTEVVAAPDSEELKGQGIAARFGSTMYSSSSELLDREEVDFAFAFGRHSEMPALAEALRARN